ncbi:MAG: 23S rRNA (guanosine(2251)-2'-O)-methyltransferase RlmB [Clostridia bacterium]|nr:23S rRNA (guanosine(2251)-2'-O)-methyltransferase RlmB [Clostridia bacterium]
MEKDNSGVLVGRNAVKELLRSGRDVDKILIAKGAGHGVADIIKLAKERRVVISNVPASRLDELANGLPHQGVAAFAAEEDYATLDDIFALAEERGEPPLIVIADEISDPHNLGAIIRCAEGAGAHGIIVPKRRSSGLTQVVAKSSAGALSWLPVVRATNLAREVEELKKRGVWVWAAEAGGSPYYENDLTGATAIIMGSEGEGVSRLLKEKSDFMISIPMYGKVTSFNVSTASAVILCEAARQRHAGGRKGKGTEK